MTSANDVAAASTRMEEMIGVERVPGQDAISRRDRAFARILWFQPWRTRLCAIDNPFCVVIQPPELLEPVPASRQKYVPVVSVAQRLPEGAAHVTTSPRSGPQSVSLRTCVRANVRHHQR